MSAATETTNKIGYARVSTLEQAEALQRDALGAADCGRVFVDKASGKPEHRPALDAMIEQLRPGDTVVVWRLDRLGRSLRNLVDLIEEFDARGVRQPDREHRQHDPGATTTG